MLRVKNWNLLRVKHEVFALTILTTTFMVVGGVLLSLHILIYFAIVGSVFFSLYTII